MQSIQVNAVKKRTIDTYTCISRGKINTDLRHPLVYSRTLTIENLLLMKFIR